MCLQVGSETDIYIEVLKKLVKEKCSSFQVSYALSIQIMHVVANPERNSRSSVLSFLTSL